MKNILKADLCKLKYNRGVKLLPLAVVVASLAMVAVTFFVSSGAKVEGGSVAIADMYGFEPAGRAGAKALVTLSNIYGFIAVIFAGLFTATEFTQGTIRNALCVGVSRTKVYLSKLAVSLIFLAVCMAISCIVFIVSFSVFFGFGDAAGFLRETVLLFRMQWLYHCAYAAIGCFLSFLIPNIVITVAAGMGIVIFSGILNAMSGKFDALNGLGPFIPNYYITRLNGELHNTQFLVMGGLLCIAIITLTAVIGCAAFNRRYIK
jgi:ABC-type transport system involved in multi-copper enzyme maturation permease subunit